MLEYNPESEQKIKRTQKVKVLKRHRKVSRSLEVCDDKMMRVGKVNNVISSSLEAGASGQFEYIEWNRCRHVMTYDLC